MAVRLALLVVLLVGSYGPSMPFPAIHKAASAAVAPSDDAIDLGTLGGTTSIALGINATSEVVGLSETSQGQIHAFLWQNGQMTDLGTLGGTVSQANAINATGQVVGYSQTSQEEHAFLWQNGQMVDLGFPSGTVSRANAINDIGQVVGYSQTGLEEDRAFLWQNGQATNLGTLGGSFSRANAINTTGQVVGRSQTSQGQPRAFLWQNGQMTDLGTLGGASGDAWAINDAGQVVGSSRKSQGEEHAFLWQNGQMTDLGTLGGTTSVAYAINTTGQVVGYSQTSQGQFHAFLWQNGQMVDLESLLPAGSSWTFRSISQISISDSGIIVGRGLIGGQTHAFAMFSADPPSAVCTDPQVPAPLRGLQAQAFGALTVRADSFSGGANWTASGTVWLGSHVVVEDASITLSGGSLSGSGLVSMVTATGPERVTPLLKDSFAVDPSGTLTPAAANGFELRLTRLGGFCVKPDRYQLGLDLVHGVATGSADLWLRVPEQPLVDRPFSFTLRSGGNLSGLLLAPVTFDLGLIDLKVTKALLDSTGITTKEASLLLNAVLGGASVLLPNGAFRLTADAGLATTVPILLPNIKFGPNGDFGIEGVRAILTFGGGSYRFVGSGTLVLPGVASSSGCKIGSALELVSTPPPIREASLSISGGCVKIPIGATGAFITGFSGKVTATETDLALDFTMSAIYGDAIPNLGSFLNGTFGAHWDTTWSVGLNGTVKTFLWDAGNANLTLGPNDGLRGTVTLRMVPVLEGTARIHAWEDGAGYHLTGHADTTVVMRTGALIQTCTTITVQVCLVVPPTDFVGPSENADFGQFRTPLATSVYGLKGYVSAFGFQPAFFVDVDGNLDFDLGGLQGYQLVDQPVLSSLQALAVPDAVSTMAVEASPALIVGLAHDTGNLTLTLTDPNGRTIDASTVAADVFVSTTAGQTVYTIANPAAGTWTVRVGNRSGDEEYVLRAFGATVAPQITQVPTPTPTTNGYTIAFAGTGGAQTTYALFYDDDNQGNDGRPIAQGVPLSQTTVVWDTRAIPAGSYSVYAMLDDPAAAPVFAYSTAPVVVSDVVAPDAPSGVAASLAGDEATISWTPPSALDLAGYRIAYTEPGNGQTFMTDVPNPLATGYVQPGLALPGTWTIAVSAYDINGNTSAPSAAVPVAVAPAAPVPTPVGVTPAGGPAAGGTPVTISGLDFLAGATVTFGDVAATDVQVVDAQTITAVAPPHAVERVAVIVTNPGGQQGTLTAGYDYTSPSPSPAPLVTLTLTTSGPGSNTSGRAPVGTTTSATTFQYAVDTAVTLTPQPASETIFIGWQVDGVDKGWAVPFALTMNNNHAVVASFAPTKSFADVPANRDDATAIRELASRGTIRGYNDTTYGPDDGMQRAQMAALIARATAAGPGTPPTTLTPPACVAAGSWDCEDWGNGFSDRNGLDANLWRNVGALQHYQVAFGYDGAACAARGVASPCYAPTAPVSSVETVVFITRAMIAKGYWVAQPNAPQPYAGVPAVFGPTVATYHYYTVGAGGVPAPPSDWNAGATRGWFARALWQALNTYWATDGTLPDGRPAGGQLP